MLCRARDNELRAVAAVAAAAFSAGGSISVSSIGRRTGMSGKGAKRGAVDPAPGWSAYRSGPGPRSTAPPERTTRNGVVDPEPGWSAHVSGPGPRSTTPWPVSVRGIGIQHRRFWWQHWQQQGSGNGMRKPGETCARTMVPLSTCYILLRNAHGGHYLHVNVYV